MFNMERIEFERLQKHYLNEIKQCKQAIKVRTKKKRCIQKYNDKIAHYEMELDELRQKEFSEHFYRAPYEASDVDLMFGFKIKLFTKEKLLARYAAKKKDAKSRGIEFKLSLETFCILMNERYCYFTGIEFKNVREISIDRVDNNIGYTDENCVACYSIYNGIKSDLTISEITGVYERIISGKNKRFTLNFTDSEIISLYEKVIAFTKRKTMAEFNPAF